jgi:hypothetical protein
MENNLAWRMEPDLNRELVPKVRLLMVLPEKR